MANKKREYLLPRSTTRTLSIKCYEEQMPKGWKEVKRKIRSRNKSKMQVLAILHDNDPDYGDFWGASSIKSHYHIIVRVIGKSPMYVSTILNELGIIFRNPEDETLWKEHGVESIANFANMAMYLTHETEQAMLDGKTIYDIKKIVSNLEPEEINQIRDGYIRVSVGKVGNKEMAQLDAMAYELGWNLGDFGEWYGNLSFMERSNSKMRKVEESYYRGVEKRAEMDDQLVRLCVFIQGDGNTGKTYACKKAFNGKKFIPIEAGGNGRFDDIKPYTEALIINDDTAPNLLPMTDNYICKVYRRNSNNPYWCGRYFVVTSNKSFEQWALSCGEKVYEDYHNSIYTKEFEALKSRFYICSAQPYKDGGHILYCEQPSIRGTKEEQEERLKMFCEFRDKVNASMLSYRPEEQKIDYSNINGEYEIKENQVTEIIEKTEQRNMGTIHETDIPYYENKGFKLYDDESPIEDKDCKNRYIRNEETREEYRVFECFK